MWYSSGYRWEENKGVLKSYYKIRTAESADGIRWGPTGQVAIDHAHPEDSEKLLVGNRKIGWPVHFGILLVILASNFILRRYLDQADKHIVSFMELAYPAQLQEIYAMA